MKITIEQIHKLLLNGQKKQMAEKIKAYGECSFFIDYEKFLSCYAIPANEPYINHRFQWFADCVISYHRVMNK